MSVAVRASGLTKVYQDGVRRVAVLKGVDLAIEPGELVAIVGPSGSGKSTLLHLLGALDRPDGGTVEIGGESLARLSGAQLAAFRNRTIGFVFQFHQLLPDFTALENVMLPGRIAGIEPRRVLERARDLLLEVGLEERLEHFPNQLSGGSGSGSPSAGRWRSSRRCCSPTSRRGTSTRRAARRSSSSSSPCRPATAPPASWSPTIRRSPASARGRCGWMAECYTRIEKRTLGGAGEVASGGNFAGSGALDPR